VSSPRDVIAGSRLNAGIPWSPPRDDSAIKSRNDRVCAFCTHGRAGDRCDTLEEVRRSKKTNAISILYMTALLL
jgi:hypothetical protein